jgi:endonuclease YncB( thermonuclease family)
MAFALLLLSGSARAAQLFGHIVAVGDGDTLTLRDAENRQHKVRLSAIDAPERRQPYGERAKQHLADLAHGKPAMVVWNKRDRYGRIVGRVLLRQCAAPQCPYTTDAGLEQVRAGLAWHYKQYAKEQSPVERVRYSWHEREARAKREGLWREAEPIPPWQFRRPFA